MRNQITNSLEHAAASLTPAPLGVGEIMVPAVTGKLETVADEVVTIAIRFGGSATKGLADQGRLSVLVDLPSNREPEFRAEILSMVGEATPGTSAFAEPPSQRFGVPGVTADKTTPATAAQASGSPSPTTNEKKSFVVQIVEAGAGRPK